MAARLSTCMSALLALTLCACPRQGGDASAPAPGAGAEEAPALDQPAAPASPVSAPAPEEPAPPAPPAALVASRGDVPAFDAPLPATSAARALPPAPVQARADITALRALLEEADLFGVGEEREVIEALMGLSGEAAFAFDPETGAAFVDAGAGPRPLRGDAPALSSDAAPEEVALPLPVGAVLRVRASHEAALTLATWLPASSGGVEFVVFEDGSIIFDFEGVAESALVAALGGAQAFSSVALGQASASAPVELQGFVRLAAQWAAGVWSRVHVRGDADGSRLGLAAPRCGGPLRSLTLVALVGGALEVQADRAELPALGFEPPELMLRASCASAVRGGALPLDALRAPALSASRRGALLADASALVRHVAPDAAGLLPFALPDRAVVEALGRGPLGVASLEEAVPVAYVWWAGADGASSRAAQMPEGSARWLGDEPFLQGTRPVPLPDGSRLLSPDGLRTQRRMQVPSADTFTALGGSLPEGTLAALVFERDALASLARGVEPGVAGALGPWEAVSVSLSGAGSWRLGVHPAPLADPDAPGLEVATRGGVWGLEGSAGALLRAGLALVPDAARRIPRGAIGATPGAPAWSD